MLLCNDVCPWLSAIPESARIVQCDKMTGDHSGIPVLLGVDVLVLMENVCYMAMAMG